MSESNPRPPNASIGKWLAIGLTTLVVLFLVATSYGLRRARHRSAALVAIQDTGGWFWTRPAVDVPTWLHPVTDRWLSECIDTVGIRNEDLFTDMENLLPWLSETRMLHLESVALPATGLSFIESMDDLQGLRCDQTRLSNVDLEYLPANLDFLYMRGTGISDEGFQHVYRFHNLTQLFAVGESITDRGTAKVSELSQLEGLSFPGTNITDVTMSRLANLCRLDYLDLGGCPITDAGMPHLGALEQLEYLSLYETNVSDAGMNYLAFMRNLKSPTPDSST